MVNSVSKSKFLKDFIWREGERRSRCSLFVTEKEDKTLAFVQGQGIAIYDRALRKALANHLSMDGAAILIVNVFHLEDGSFDFEEMFEMRPGVYNWRPFEDKELISAYWKALKQGS